MMSKSPRYPTATSTAQSHTDTDVVQFLSLIEVMSAVSIISHDDRVPFMVLPANDVAFSLLLNVYRIQTVILLLANLTTGHTVLLTLVHSSTDMLGSGYR